MSLQTRMPALRTPAMKWLLAAGAALVAVAVPASAGLGLPIGTGQHIDTPVSSTDLSASDQGADLCNGVSTPALPPLPATPAVPALPVPVPVPVPSAPSLPTLSAASDACVHAGLDGASASIGGDAAGSHIGAGAQANSPVDAGQAVSDAKSTADGAKGFFDSLVDTLFGWI